MNKSVSDGGFEVSIGESEEERVSVELAFNPQYGKYQVETEAGSTFKTQREEKLRYLLELAKADPRVMQVGADILIKLSDAPYRDELIERLQKLMPQQAGQGESEQGAPALAKFAQDKSAINEQLAKEIADLKTLLQTMITGGNNG